MSSLLLCCRPSLRRSGSLHFQDGNGTLRSFCLRPQTAPVAILFKMLFKKCHSLWRKHHSLLKSPQLTVVSKGGKLLFWIYPCLRSCPNGWNCNRNRKTRPWGVAVSWAVSWVKFEVVPFALPLRNQYQNMVCQVTWKNHHETVLKRVAVHYQLCCIVWLQSIHGVPTMSVQEMWACVVTGCAFLVDNCNWQKLIAESCPVAGGYSYNLECHYDQDCNSGYSHESYYASKDCFLLQWIQDHPSWKQCHKGRWILDSTLDLMLLSRCSRTSSQLHGHSPP